MKLKRILLVEDEDLLRLSLQQTLEASGYEVTGLSSGKAALDLYQSNPSPQAPWDLIVMDVNLMGYNGLEVQRTLRDLGAQIPFVFMSAHQRAFDVNQAWRDGASDFLFKPFTPSELLRAIEEALARSAAQSVELDDTADPDVHEKFRLLTPRQKDVLRLVARGLSNTQISAQLGIAARTVKMHRESIMHRFGFTHVTHLVRFHDACKHLF